MHPLSLLLPATALAVIALVAGCGTDDTGAGSPRPSQSPSDGDFPIAVTREGGVAGFSDTVVVSADGQVTVAGRDPGAACALPDPVLRELAALARPVSGTATTRPAHPDDLVVVLGTPHGSTRLSDAQLSGQAAVVTRLLEDLAREPAGRTVCR